MAEWVPAVADASGSRLTAVALGGWADAMVRGARALFGTAIDEVIIASPGPTARAEGDTSPGRAAPPMPPEGVVRFEADPLAAGRYLRGWCDTLTSTDRVLLLLSPGEAEAATVPLAPATLDELTDLAASSGRLSAEQIAGARARLDQLRGGGLAALLGAASVVGVGWRGQGPDYGPFGNPPPSGRALEIELRRAGVDLPFGVVQALRGDGSAHPAERELPVGPRQWRLLGEGGDSVESMLAAAREAGAAATVLTRSLRGDAEAAGRGMARVAQAIADGMGGLRLPAVALASGRLEGGVDRHARLRAGAETDLAGARAVVEAWSPLAGAPDLVAVVVTEPSGGAQLQSGSERSSTGI